MLDGVRGEGGGEGNRVGVGGMCLNFFFFWFC